MRVIGSIVKPILEEMGLFKGAEVSVKEAFEKYLKVCPEGIGPLHLFKAVVADDLHLAEKEVRIEGNLVDFLFYYNKNDDLLYYDPRKVNPQNQS